MTTAIKAIETEYAGCRFRSRLEARWAVFFDALSIKWLYEPQGYILGNGDAYLPDFWLPDLQLWVEVKGAPNEAEWIKLHAATAAEGLPLVYGRGQTPMEALGKDDLRRIPALNRILLLGEVPRPSTGCGWAHLLTTLTANGPAFHLAFFWGAHAVQVEQEWPWPSKAEFLSGSDSMDGVEFAPVKSHPSVSAAYDAARRARFEHGERG
jgi:hypothetical protein